MKTTVKSQRHRAKRTFKSRTGVSLIQGLLRKDAVLAALISLCLVRAVTAAERRSPESSPRPQRSLEIHITDSGINQSENGRDLKTGDDFSHAKAHVFSDIPNSGQILIVMPADEDFSKIRDATFTKAVFDTLKRRVNEGVALGTGKYELQLAQNINTKTYFDRNHQADADRFGKCAYKAIGMLNDYLKENGFAPHFDATVGSNGAKVLTDNFKSWKPYLKALTIYDGRAFEAPTAASIKAIGAQNVRIFNTAGDWPAPGFVQKSIGNHEVVKGIKQRFPGLTVGLLDPIDRMDVPIVGTGHLAGMHDSSRFQAKYLVNSHSYTVPQKITGKDLQTSWTPGVASKPDARIREYSMTVPQTHPYQGEKAIASTMAVQARDAKRVLIVADDPTLRGIIQKRLAQIAPQATVTPVPYSSPDMYRQQAKSFGADAILVVR